MIGLEDPDKDDINAIQLKVHCIINAKVLLQKFGTNYDDELLADLNL